MVSRKFGDSSELRRCWGWPVTLAGLSIEGRTPGRGCYDEPDHAYGLRSEGRMDNRDGWARSGSVRDFYLSLFVQAFDRRTTRRSQMQAEHVAELFKEQSGQRTACWHVPA
jgi:hypothetical protein